MPLTRRDYARNLKDYASGMADTHVSPLCGGGSFTTRALIPIVNIRTRTSDQIINNTENPIFSGLSSAG